MSYVVYVGKRPRDPRQVLRLVRPDGTALHVLDIPDPAEVEKITQRNGVAAYDDRQAAIRDALERGEARS